MQRSNVHYEQVRLSLPLEWTAIAERPREPVTNEMLTWRELAEAPLRLPEAKELAVNGAILMAQRHFSDRVQLVVRPVISVSINPSKPQPRKRARPKQTR